MSKTKSLISKIIADLQTGISANNLNKRGEVTGYALSSESFDEHSRESAIAATETLNEIVIDTINTVITTEGFSDTDFTPAQYEAAKRIAALALDPRKTIEASRSLEGVARPVDATVISTESLGVDNAIGEDFKLSTEAFDGQQINNALYWSISYNFGAARQDEFCEAFFPSIVTDPTKSGYIIETELTNIINEYDRDISGTPDREKSKKTPLVKALYDNELLDSTKNKLAPVLRNENKSLLLDNLTLEAKSNGDTVTSAPIKFGKKVGLLAISQTDALLSKGKLNNTDALDRALTLDRVYYSIAGNDSKGNKVVEYFYTDVSVLPHSNFVYSQQDHHKDLSLTFETSDIAINVGTTLTAKAASSVLLKNLNATGYTIKLKVKLHGEANTEFGDISVYASSVELDSIQDANGNNVVHTDAIYTTIAALFQTVNLEGYTVEAFRTNSNLRTRGTLFGYEKYTDVISNIPLRSGISIYTPISSPTGTDNDAGRLTAQIQAIGLQTSVDGVKKLTSFAETLNSITNNGRTSKIELMGIGRYHFDTYFNEQTINLADYVDSVKSTERLDDIRAALINTIQDEVTNMWIESNYGVAFTTANQGLNVKPTIIIGTDVKTKKYLTNRDGKIDLGGDFEAVVVSTPNALIKGKIYLAFGIYDENRNVRPNPFNFGNFIWSPTITMDVTKTGDSGAIRELNNIPRYLHIVHTPILSVLNISGISTTLRKVTANRHSV